MRTNYVLKNYGKALRKIKSDKNIKVEARKQLTLKMIDELMKQVQKAIYSNNTVDELKDEV